MVESSCLEGFNSHGGGTWGHGSVVAVVAGGMFGSMVLWGFSNLHGSVSLSESGAFCVGMLEFPSDLVTPVTEPF